MVLVFFLILFAILRRVSFILKTDQFLHTVPLTDFLPGSTCSAELGAAVVQVRWKSRQSGAERRFRDASENTSIAYSSGGRVGAVALCIIKIRIKIWQHGMKILPNYEGHRVKSWIFSLLVC